MRDTTTSSSRARAIARAQQRLEQESFPRTQMALLVTVTGGFGLLASFVMLQLGVESMALRYPLALLFAYLFFLFLIWLWLRTNAADYVDLANVPDGLPRPNGSARLAEFKSGGGGDFAGGGASGSFDAPASAAGETAAASMKSVGESAGLAADADEFTIPLVAIVLAICIALASLYVVYIAPVLLAEVLVDSALSYALFRHLRGQDPYHWLSSAFQRTILPFTATAIFLVAVGAGMAAYAPGARSIGQVVKHAATQRAAQ